MSETAVTSHCKKKEISISSIGKVAGGGTRLVCTSVDGAAQVRRELSSKLMKDEAAREQHGPGWGFVERP
jgi:hypothetical protein